MLARVSPQGDVRRDLATRRPIFPKAITTLSRKPSRRRPSGNSNQCIDHGNQYIIHMLMGAPTASWPSTSNESGPSPRLRISRQSAVTSSSRPNDHL